MSPTGMGYRFFMLFVPVSIFAAVFFMKNINIKIIYGITAFILILTGVVYSTVDIAVFDPPTVSMKKYPAEQEILSGRKNVNSWWHTNPWRR